jgi:hypothetical protein
MHLLAFILLLAARPVAAAQRPAFPGTVAPGFAGRVNVLLQSFSEGRSHILEGLVKDPASLSLPDLQAIQVVMKGVRTEEAPQIFLPEQGFGTKEERDAISAQLLLSRGAILEVLKNRPELEEGLVHVAARLPRNTIPQLVSGPSTEKLSALGFGPQAWRPPELNWDGEQAKDSLSENEVAQDPAQVARLVEAHVAGKLGDPIFDDPQAPLWARTAYQEGRLTSGQLATLVLRQEARIDFGEDVRKNGGGLRRIPVLLADGHLSTAAREVFVGATESQSSDKARRMTPSEAKTFETILAGLPETERNLWVWELTAKTKLGKCSSIWAGLESLFSQIFMRHPNTYQSHKSISVPSFGLLQAILDVRSGADAVRLLPTFSKTSRASIMRDIGESGRVFGLHYPGLVQDVQADGVYAGQFFFSMHDFFHAFYGSFTPLAYRRFFPRIVALIRKRQDEIPAAGGPVTPAWTELDSRSQSFTDLGPESLNFSGSSIEERLSNDMNPSPYSSFGDYLGDRSLAEMLAEDLALHPEKWKDLDIGKAVSLLRSTAQKVYEAAVQRTRKPSGPQEGDRVVPAEGLPAKGSL